MSEHRRDANIDRSRWPSGPWDDEPDHEEWTDPDTGLACIVLRNGRMGHLCGYVGVPAGHPWHGRDYQFIDAEAHYELTFSSPARPVSYLSRPYPGDDPHGLWWVGFDAAHAFDLTPSMALSEFGYGGCEYRTWGYMKEMCGVLARQAAAALTEESPDE